MREVCQIGLARSRMIYRRPQVEQLIGLSRSTIYKAISEGSFPPPIRLGKRAVGWLQSDIEDWLQAKNQGGDHE